MALISTPGIYDIPEEIYHREECCVAPSISSSGLRAILECPIKYWHNSPLNPNRPPEETKRHFTVGKAAHDLILLGSGWPDRYHVTPAGFNAAHTKKWAEYLPEYDDAISAGKIIMRSDDYDAVQAMAQAIKEHPFAAHAFANGEAEKTLAWKDSETDVWLRVRPDFLPKVRRHIPDFKTAISAHPDDFRKAIWNYGYHQQAAHYLDGIEAVTGTKPDHFFFVICEKDAPHVITVIDLDVDAIAWGRMQNRRAIRIFARCLETGYWPGYADDVVTVGLPVWAEKELQAAHERGDFSEIFKQKEATE